MFCKNCNKSFNKNLTVCPYCGFDNAKEINIGDTTEINISSIKLKGKAKKDKVDPTIVFIVAIIIIGSVLTIRYILFDSKSSVNNPTTNTTTKEVINTKEYKYDNITLYHTLDLEAKDNIIYLINNHDIYIKIDIISDDTYYDIINNNDMLDATLNEVETKTYANDNIYGYLISTSKKKYHITVNYNDTITEEIQGNINKTLKSIKIKE